MLHEQRFWTKVDVDGPCWEWLAGKDGCGYGMYYAEGRTARAHRYAWLRLVGDIPLGTELDHLCGNRACVCPEHLEPVTHQENVRRGGRSRWSHCPKGHRYTEENVYLMTRRDGSTTRRCRTCRREAMKVWEKANRRVK